MIQVQHQVEWERRTARIEGVEGVVFEQRDVEVPSTWSQLATNVVASKYFRGKLGTPKREYSVGALIHRVVDTQTTWGILDGYFRGDESTIFFNELTYLLTTQKASFNSPVWFNVGFEEHPQASACFILSLDDTMESILEWVRQEGMIFKGGSGSGVNVSRLRSSVEQMSTGGRASGPLSFMKFADVGASVIKSGGKVRRAAKMVIMDIDHPDIGLFIQAKVFEELKAQALLAAGFSNGMEGDAYTTVAYQSANHSVRVTDAFMQAVRDDLPWATTYRTTGEVAKTYQARELFRALAEATHACGDPGMQFDDTINAWHTSAGTAPIYGSNPCSEFMYLDDTACNLASINLLQFLNDDNTFDVQPFQHAVDLLITAQDIMVDRAGYPTDAITRNSKDFRPLGLGYCNLGALLMCLGLPYDSDAGRDYAAAITALMTGQAYACSAALAKQKGAFTRYPENQASMMNVIQKHVAACEALPHTPLTATIRQAARIAWDTAREEGSHYGYRNAQVTLLAPTGTIAFMMDADTTGVEPSAALVMDKALVGGGSMRVVNHCVGRALRALGYGEELVHDIEWYVDEHHTVEGCRDVSSEHLAVFDCALPTRPGGRSIAWQGHVKMLGAVQPFLSGSVSKTINMPADCTVDDIEQAYILGWELGVKSLAIYRDGCKKSQPITVKNQAQGAGSVVHAPARRVRLPNDRPALTHKGNIAGHEFYVTVGLYDDGKPGEMFLTMAKQGSTVSGLCDTIGVLTSLLLQYGVPLSVLSTKLRDSRFEPSGFTTNKDIPLAKSIVDYIFRWLEQKFGDYVPEAQITIQEGLSGEMTHIYTDAPACPMCGTLMASRNGSCFGCLNCGQTSGCS